MPGERINNTAKVATKTSWADNDPKRERGWVVKRFVGHMKHAESGYPDLVGAEFDAENWLREHSKHFTLHAMTVDNGNIYLAGVLS